MRATDPSHGRGTARIDVHPEELFDREQAGTLTAEQQARLDLHLAQCAACRLERQLRADFAAELSPALHVASLHNVVLGALQAAQVPVAEPGSAQAPEGAPLSAHAPEGALRLPALASRSVSRWPVRRAAAALALALAVGIGAAAAQTGLLARVWHGASELVFLTKPGPARSHSAPVAARPEAPDRRTDGTASAHAAPPTPTVSDQPSARADSLLARPSARFDASEQAGPVRQPAVRRGDAARHAAGKRRPHPSTASGAAARRHASDRSSPALAARPAVGAASSRSELGPATPASHHEPQTSTPGWRAEPHASSQLQADQLFELATAARQRGDVLEASGLYRELRARFPESAQARLSLAVVARMQLDRGETRSALLGFEAYLETGERGLREEAMAGRALSLERLGRGEEAARAFERLLDAYPGSAYGRAYREPKVKVAP